MDEGFFDGGRAQRADYRKLLEAIDEAPVAPPCENFPEAYYAGEDNPGDRNLALSGCRVCPVMNECGIYGLKWETSGIWGGMTARKRRDLRAAARAA